MVLGFIDFLLGRNKKAASSQSGSQVSQPQQGETEGQEMGGSQQQESSSPATEQQSVNPGKKKSISEAFDKLNKELKETNDKLVEMTSSIKEMESSISSLDRRVESLEEAKKQTDDKMAHVEEDMSKFLSLYELVNNQYNPFVESDGKIPVEQRESIAVTSDGSSESVAESGGEESNNHTNTSTSSSAKTINLEGDDLDTSLLELDTLNIEEAAGDAVPLTSLKNNTNSLVIILSWLEYLVKRIGTEETRNTLRYYTEVLRWITPEVYFELDKYLRGMKDRGVEEGDSSRSLTVRDHIVSLYFISKLNEKALDERLTRAVLKIIKQ